MTKNYNVPTYPKPPAPPHPPPLSPRILEGGGCGICPKCHSSLTRKYWLFGEKKCIHTLCPTHNKLKKYCFSEGIAVRHIKTGGLYFILSYGLLESDKTPVVVYKSLSDKQVWIRPVTEFEDGRFELFKT
jgi:hypothetical protein